MREAYQKLNKTLQNGERYMSLWSTAPFTIICADAVHDTPVSLRDPGCVDALFCNEASRRACRQFRKFNISKENDTTFLTVIRLDAIITYIIDSFTASKSNMDNTNIEHESDQENEEKLNHLPSYKGGLIPIYSLRGFKTLLPAAASQFLTSSFILIKHFMEEQPVQIDIETNFRKSGYVTQRLNNLNRTCMVDFYIREMGTTTYH